MENGTITFLLFPCARSQSKYMFLTELRRNIKKIIYKDKTNTEKWKRKPNWTRAKLVISHIKISEQSSRKRYVPYLFPSCVNFSNILRWTPPKFLWLEIIRFCTKHVYLFVQFPSAINIGASALNLPLPGQKYLWAKMTWPILSKPNFP